MEYVNMKEWLDKLIQNTEERISLVNFNSKIRTYSIGKRIPIFEFIEEIADIMGIELEENEKETEKYGGYFYYSFVYKGYEFYQLNEKRLERFDGTD